MVQFDATRRTLPGLNPPEPRRDVGVLAREPVRRCCMAVVSSCREMLGYVPQRAQPLSSVANRKAEHSGETADVKSEEGGDDVKSSWPLCPGLHTCYNGRYKGLRQRKLKPISKNRPQFRLESATRLHEVGIASNPGPARRGEYVPGPCTHRPSHHGSQLLQKSVCQPQGGSRSRSDW